MRARFPLIAAWLLFSAHALAQAGTLFNRTGSGARAAGMANAFIGVSDDGTAASWNPAGLGQLRKPELSVVTSTSTQSFATQGFRTLDNRTGFTPQRASFGQTYLDFASLALPVTIASKPVTFQAAWRRLYTLDFRSNSATLGEPLGSAGAPTLRFEENSDTVGSIDLLPLAVALKLTPRVAVGASLNLWRGDWTESTSLSETTLDPPGATAFLTTHVVNRVRGHNLGLGLMLTHPRWSVGVLHQGPLLGNFSNSARIATSSDAEPGTASNRARLRFPRSVGLGAAWRPAALWTVALDLTWDDWTGARIEPEGLPAVNLFDGLPAERSSTRDTWSASAGAEHLIRGEGFVVPLRFGLAWEPQGQRSPYTLDPVDYKMLALGTGYNTNTLKFDAAVQYRWSRYMDGGEFTLEPRIPELPHAVGERSVREWRVKVSLILRLADTDKLRRGVRKLFGGG